MSTVATRLQFVRHFASRCTSVTAAGSNKTITSMSTSSRTTSLMRTSEIMFNHPTTTTTSTMTRDFSVHSAATVTDDDDRSSYETLVKETIKRMMNERDHNVDDDEDNSPISDDELESRFKYYMKVFEEAELCLKDLQEVTPSSNTEYYVEECSCAKNAVNNAFVAYVDLLEDLRRANDTQLERYSEIRNANASNLKQLRQDLDRVLMSNDQPPVSRHVA